MLSGADLYLYTYCLVPELVLLDPSAVCKHCLLHNLKMSISPASLFMTVGGEGKRETGVRIATSHEECMKRLPVIASS